MQGSEDRREGGGSLDLPGSEHGNDVRERERPEERDRRYSGPCGREKRRCVYEICYRVVETKDRNQRLTDGMHVRELDGWADIHKPLTSESEMDCGLVKFEDMP